MWSIIIIITIKFLVDSLKYSIWAIEPFKFLQKSVAYKDVPI